jgi:UDP-N-acetylmuramoylalanine--D-glutamate ligase
LGKLAHATGSPVISELEFGARYCACPLLAVTGTNGKTTTVELTTHLLAGVGLRVQSAGNIGLPLSACALTSGDLDALVVEVSSFQLEAVERFRPAAAALLNVTPDHYDRHGGPEPYLAAKLALFRRMPAADRIVLRRDLIEQPAISRILSAMSGAPLLFAAEPDDRCTFFADGHAMYERRDGTIVRLAGLDELALVGRHNIENALASLALVRAGGQSPQRAAAGLHTFRPSRHRLELVAERDGVRYVNDSKATNVDALCRALETVADTHLGRRVLLLAGGVDKDIDFSAVLPMLENQVREAFLIGTCKGRLAKEWQGVVSCQQFLTLEEAVSAASTAARPGDVVLLSPGCASQDMFRNYAHRGDQFRALVKRRAGE